MFLDIFSEMKKLPVLRSKEDSSFFSLKNQMLIMLNPAST
ncbi:hypothetical protein NBRC111894_1400 [Sporolactobacillus inulinus]|uniref:Uncharacterized protein n=1 Tax=Sporolactobacillus inulinus TaxID=2078 RepID=A0A4Y1Z9Z6_9BACL|nr:hypothetical protein NBRC111894_1400 [Sporolactobacillus inulinus]